MDRSSSELDSGSNMRGKMAKGAKRRARKCITVADKLKVISELKKGTAVKEVAKLFAISKTQVYDIYKHRDTIEKSLSSGSTATGVQVSLYAQAIRREIILRER